MDEIKVAVIGAGSSYTPELIDGFIKKKDNIKIQTLSLMDIDNERLDIITGMVERMFRREGLDVSINKTTKLEEAIMGADFVINQIRVGGLEARILDEKIPLKYDLLGQETTGVGGFINALRTIPQTIKIAKTMEKYSPEGWLLNFSNPAGLVMEAVLNNTSIKGLGLCNGPLNMLESIKNILGDSNFEYDFVGLNHLCWITAVYVKGENIIEEILNGEQLKISKLKNIPEMEYDPLLLKATGGFPIGYLNYYYFRDLQLKKCQEAEKTRGEVCKEIERELLAKYRDPAVNTKPDILNQRGGAMYSQAAVSIIDSIVNDKRELHIVNVKNEGAYDFMEASDVVEVKSIVGKDGIQPVKLEDFENDYIIGMMKAVKAYEKLTVKAALTGDISAALAALMVHPLIGDYYKAKNVLQELLAVNRQYLPQFEDGADDLEVYFRD